MLRLQKMGSVTFDYGNNIRTFAFQRGVKNAYDFPGFVPAYIRPLFCEGARAVPVGGAFGRGFGYCRHRRSGAGTFSGESQPAALD
jgi:hypothetical protein